MAILSIIISIFALIIAFSSLYFTHLRSANIVLSASRLENRTDIEGASAWSSTWPVNFALFYKLNIENLGSNPGCLEGLKVKIEPQEFDTFRLMPNNQIYSTERTNNSYKLLGDGERIVVNDKALIPIMVRLYFSPKFREEERTQENFKTMWEELLDLKSQNKPVITIEYTALQHLDWLTRLLKRSFLGIRKPVVIKNIAGDVIGVFVGRLNEIAKNPGQEYYEAAKECLEKLNQG